MFFISLSFSVLGFLLGGILFSYHIPKRLCGVDVVSSSPDRNPGTANAMKLCGVPVGLTCLALDLMKGYLPVHLALRLLPLQSPWFAPVMIAPALGHALAVFYPFKGGKAVAVSFGVLLGLAPVSWAVLLLVAPYLFFSLIVVINPHERRSLCSFFVLAVLCLLDGLYQRSAGLALGGTGVALIAMWKNRVKEPREQPQPGEAAVVAVQKRS